jgi:hypothetical protein
MSIVVEDAGLIGFRQFSCILDHDNDLSQQTKWTHGISLRIGLINLGLFGGK